MRNAQGHWDELQATLQPGEQLLRGRLRVDMSGGAARLFVVPQLAESLQAHPLIELELSSMDRLVERVHEGFDCVLRVRALIDSRLVARPLGAFRIVNCATRAYLQQYGTPKTLDDLANHRLIHCVSTLGARLPGWERPVASAMSTCRCTAASALATATPTAPRASAGCG